MCYLNAPPRSHSLSRLQGQQPSSLPALSQPAVSMQISSEIQDSTFPPQK